MINNRNELECLCNKYFIIKIILWMFNFFKKRLQNPRWLLMLAITRFKTVSIIPTCKPTFIKKAVSNDSIFKNLNTNDIVESLTKDGFYLGIKLPENILQELLSFASSTDCYGNGKYQIGFAYAEKEKAEEKCGSFIRGTYFNTSLLCPAIKKLATDPKLLDIAAHYLGGEPVCAGTKLEWLFSLNEQNQRVLLKDMNFLSLKSNTRSGTYFFHYDLDDYNCLKFYFYLTDADLFSGVHFCVRGSHKKKKLAHILSIFRRCSDEQIIDDYGAENVVPICGAAGFGFVEDTFCFHKVTPPSRRDRLTLQIQFTLNDYGHNDLVDPSLLKNCC